MSINIKKSAGLTIAKDGKRKCMVLVPWKYKTLNRSISPMGVETVQSYLGLNFTWKGKVAPKHTGKMDKMLREVSEAPLKPYQRLDILKIFLVPKLTHDLVLGNAHRNTMKRMDTLIRASILVAFLHSRVLDGGLGIPCISLTVPLAWRTRFQKLLSSKDTLCASSLNQKSFRKIERQINIPCRVAGVAVTSKVEA